MATRKLGPECITAMTRASLVKTGDVPRSHQSVFSPYFSCKLYDQTFVPSIDTQPTSPLLKYTNTCFPSVTGEEFASLALAFFPATDFPKTASHFFLPCVSTDHSVFAPSMPSVNRICCPTTIGEEAPRPGRSNFHRMLPALDHTVGYLPLAAAPFPNGPRQLGQGESSGVSA